MAFCKVECKCIGESHRSGTDGGAPGTPAGRKGGPARGMGVDKCGLINQDIQGDEAGKQRPQDGRP